MAECNYLTYKEKPLVRKGNEIYYGEMSEAFVVKFNILSTKKDGDNILPDKVNVQLLKSDIQLSDKERVVKEALRDTLFDALDIGFVWLERALKN